MCGRFVSSSSADAISKFFGASFEGEGLPANFNVAPTQDIYAVTANPEGERALQTFHWGLVPSWAKEIKVGARMINARSETVDEKPAFKGLFKKHRLLIPMDGFYEWQRPSPDRLMPNGEPAQLTKAGKPMKIPMFIHRADGDPLAVAGLWATWRDRALGPDAPWLHSCSIITTAANDTMAPVHNRMPVILEPSNWDEWLDPLNNDLVELKRLLVPAPNDTVKMHEVTTDVNNARNNGAELIEPIKP